MKTDETYREFEIAYDPPPIPYRSHDWSAVHKDAEGEGVLFGGSLEEVKREIDMYWEEQEPSDRNKTTSEGDRTMEEQLYAIGWYDEESRHGITKGKPYPILCMGRNRMSFRFLDDYGNECFPSIRSSAYLGGRGWRIVKESDLTTKERMAAGLPLKDVLHDRNDTADAMRYLFGGVDLANKKGFSGKSTEDVVIDLLKRVGALEKKADLNQQSWDLRMHLIAARLRKVEGARAEDDYPFIQTGGDYSYIEICRRVRNALQAGEAVYIVTGDGDCERIDP